MVAPEPGSSAPHSPVADQVRAVMEESGMVDALRDERTLEAEGRLENLQEFLGVAQEYDRNNPDGSLLDFLQEISLYADVDALKDKELQVTLMTLHNAKGPGVPRGVHRGHGRRRIPALALPRRAEPGGGAAALLRGHHAGHGTAVPFLRAQSIAVRRGQLQPAQPLPGRDTGKTRPPRAEWGRVGRIPSGRAPPAPTDRGRDVRSESQHPPESQRAPASCGKSIQRVSPWATASTTPSSVRAWYLGVEPGGVVRVFFSGLGEQKKLLVDYAPDEAHLGAHPPGVRETPSPLAPPARRSPASCCNSGCIYHTMQWTLSCICPRIGCTVGAKLHRSGGLCCVLGSSGVEWGS